MRFATILVIVFITAFLIWVPDTLAEDEIYRWVDKDGVVHFGNRPPENGVAESVSIPQSASVNTQVPVNPPANDAGQPEKPPPSLAQQLRDERAEARQKKKSVTRLFPRRVHKGGHSFPSWNPLPGLWCNWKMEQSVDWMTMYVSKH